MLGLNDIKLLIKMESVARGMWNARFFGISVLIW
jgi:hypothetical protein